MLSREVWRVIAVYLHQDWSSWRSWGYQGPESGIDLPGIFLDKVLPNLVFEFVRKL
jgi:hypothetical protein